MKNEIKEALEKCKKMLQGQETPTYEDYMAIEEIKMAIDWLNNGENNPAKVGNSAISNHVQPEAPKESEINKEEFPDIDEDILTIGNLRDLIKHEPENKPLGTCQTNEDGEISTMSIVGAFPQFPDGTFRLEVKNIAMELLKEDFLNAP